MYGPACQNVTEMADLLPADQMLETGLVDYALGAAPRLAFPDDARVRFERPRDPGGHA